MLKLLVITTLAIYCCHAFPRYHRLRREAESRTYGPCKNTYDQCPEWKGQGMCTSDQYKDYMMTVCPVTCEFCRESTGGETVAAVSPAPSFAGETVAAAYPASSSATAETHKSAESTGTAPDNINNAPSHQVTETTSADTENTASTESEERSPYAPPPETPETSSATTDTASAQTAPSTDSSTQSVDSSAKSTDSSAQSVDSSAQSTDSSAQSADTSTQTADTTGKIEPAKRTDQEDYQTMLKKYYENVQEQQAAYEKSIKESYPGYQSSPGLTSSEASNADAIVAAAPQQTAPVASPASSAPTAPEAQAPAAPQSPQPNSSSQPAAAPVGNSVQDPMAAASGALGVPIVLSRPETEPYNPKQTSSALYNAKNKGKNTTKVEEDSKPAKVEKETKVKASNDTSADSADDSTNEKVKSESKHLEQTIKSAKQIRKSAEKKLKFAAKNTKEHSKERKVKQAAVVKQAKLKNIENESADGEESEDSEEDEDEENESNKRTDMTAPTVIDVSKQFSNSTTKSDINTPSQSGSGSGASEADEDDVITEEESGSDSGSGDEGGLAGDLHELSMLTGLNFNDDFIDENDDTTEAEGKRLIPEKNQEDVILSSIDSRKHVRDRIEVPEEMAIFTADEEAPEGGAEEAGESGNTDSESESGNAASGNAASGNAASGNPASGNAASGNAESDYAESAYPDPSENKEEPDVKEKPNEAKEETSKNKEEASETTDNKDAISKNKDEIKASVKAKISKTPSTDTTEDSQDTEESGQSESEPEGEEGNGDGVDEEGSARDEEALPVQLEKGKKLIKVPEGTITFVLRQNFQNTYRKADTPSYQMLSGNVKKDLEKEIKGSKITDISFSDANIEGNPRQMGKTKVSFNMKNGTKKMMKGLEELVQTGSINGLSVVAGSLEFEE